VRGRYWPTISRSVRVHASRVIPSSLSCYDPVDRVNGDMVGDICSVENALMTTLLMIMRQAIETGESQCFRSPVLNAVTETIQSRGVCCPWKDVELGGPH